MTRLRKLALGLACLWAGLGVMEGQERPVMTGAPVESRSAVVKTLRARASLVPGDGVEFFSIGAVAFRPDAVDPLFDSPVGAWRGGGTFTAPLTLPDGVTLDYLTVEFYDTEEGDPSPSARLHVCSSNPEPGAQCEVLAESVPYNWYLGWEYLPIPLHILPTITIDNLSNYYYIDVNLPGTTASDSFAFRKAVGYYTKHVSAPPSVATFGDVPTDHPFFQFIEALVASGITAGCQEAPPLYCPDATLTRGQMAVFLAKALGL